MVEAEWTRWNFCHAVVQRKQGSSVSGEKNMLNPLLTPSTLLWNVGHAEVVKLLVKAHALVDKANQKGTTALMRATQEGNEEVVRILVAAGADVSKRNNERMNALMLGSQVNSRLSCCGLCSPVAQSPRYASPFRLLPCSHVIVETTWGCLIWYCLELHELSAVV